MLLDAASNSSGLLFVLLIENVKARLVLAMAFITGTEEPNQSQRLTVVTRSVSVRDLVIGFLIFCAILFKENRGFWTFFLENP